jgi:excisionase family DNA binding protein
MSDDYEGPIEIYLTTGELMDMLSVSRSTIYRWRKKGLPHLNVGATHRFPKE